MDGFVATLVEIFIKTANILKSRKGSHTHTHTHTHTHESTHPRSRRKENEGNKKKEEKTIDDNIKRKESVVFISLV